MSIDEKTLIKLAELSRLEFSPEDARSITGDLENILTFISRLQEVNTDGVQPMTSMFMGDDDSNNAYARERKDDVTAENNREEYQKTAPAADMGFYVVPRVVE